ncbi:MAG: hypothetical protein ACREVQ_15860 [Burkholderiales bacterium]
MLSRIVHEAGYVRAELFDRRTPEETRGFLDSILASATAHDCPRVLISVKSSAPLFKVEQYGLSKYFKALGGNRSYKVALVSDSDGTYASHQYIEFLARQHEARVKSFRNDAPALAWLLED